MVKIHYKGEAVYVNPLNIVSVFKDNEQTKYTMVDGEADAIYWADETPEELVDLIRNHRKEMIVTQLLAGMLVNGGRIEDLFKQANELAERIMNNETR
jgi:hypothetical protein